MVINLLVILLTIILGYFFLYKQEYIMNKHIDVIKVSYRKKFIVIISIILILQSGLRNWGVGADTFAYYNSFEKVKMLSWSQIIESFKSYYQLGIGKDPGYDLFQKIVQLFIKNYQVYLLLIAIIFFSAFGNFIYKNTSRISDAVLSFIFYSVLFYSFFSITGHRQTIATAVALYSFELVKKRKLLQFVILILLASTIHKSVLIFLPVYFIPKIKNVKFFYFIILLLFPLFFYYRTQISLYFQLISGYEYGIYDEGGTPVFTFLMLIISIFALLRYNQVTKLNPRTKVFYLLIAVALFFTPITWVNPSAMRVVQYFSIFMVVLIPEVVHSFSLVSSKMKTFIYLSILISMVFVYIRSGGTEYKFFWQEMQLPSHYWF